MKLRDWLTPVNLLLVFVPVSAALQLAHAGDVLRFGAAALAIVPLSAIMGQATEELSKCYGARWGGLLNATFGNATELIIGFLALRAGLIGLVRASIVGSILSNILLVFGASALAGGLRHKVQRFNEDLAQTNSITLLLAVAAIAVPAIFHATYRSVVTPLGPVEQLSIAVAILLLIFYVALLVFSLRTHGDELGSCVDGGADSDEPPVWTARAAIASLALALTAVGYESGLLVGSIGGATAAAHMNQIFVGIIIVPIIGNAAEHATAVRLALKNKMEIAINIALGSSIQVAMFVGPLLVLCSLFFAHRLTMLVSLPELLAVTLAVVTAAFIASDGKTNWLEGAQLLALYAILALAFYFLPT